MFQIFSMEKNVDRFLNSVKEPFVSGKIKEYKIQGSVAVLRKRDVLGEKFYEGLIEIKVDIQLDKNDPNSIFFT